MMVACGRCDMMRARTRTHTHSNIVTLVMISSVRALIVAIKTKILWSKLMCTAFVFTFEIISLFVVGFCFLSLILCLAHFTFHSNTIRCRRHSSHRSIYTIENECCLFAFESSCEELAFCLSFNHCFQWNCVCARNGKSVACIETFCVILRHSDRCMQFLILHFHLLLFSTNDNETTTWCII